MPEETLNQTIPSADVSVQSTDTSHAVAESSAAPVASVSDEPASTLVPEPLQESSSPLEPTPELVSSEPVQPEPQPQTAPAPSPAPELAPSLPPSLPHSLDFARDRQAGGREGVVVTGLSHLFAKLKEKLAGRTQKRLDKIMGYVRKKGSITNDEVQKLVYVSDATATRYLSKLVKQGKLKLTGSTKSIKYLPIA